MKPANITQIVTFYLAKNFENLKGAMPSDKHFLVGGASISEYSHADQRIAFGTAVDVLADVIEKDQFFGWYVPKSADQATHPSNAQIVLLANGSKIHGVYEVKLLENGLFIAAEKIGPKKYLDILRTPEGFIQSAGLFGIEKDLERIASAIYTS